MTALQVNGSAAAATTLAAAGKLYAATGGTSGNTSTKVGSGTLFKQIFAKGTTTNQTGVSSIPAPTDSNFSGWMWDVTTLEGQTIAAGTWTPTFHLLASTGTTITPTVQWYKRSSAGAYTSIGSVAGSSIALTTSSQALTFTPPSLSSVDFATGDKLVMWLWVNQTAGGATNSTISVVEATSGSTAGVASQAQAVTPGYAATPGVLQVTMAGAGTLAGTLTIPILVVYGSSVADTTLTTACQMAQASGGVETSKVTTSNVGTGNFFEVYSQGNASAPIVASLPTPTGHGWILYPGAGTFLAGNWALVLTYAVAVNNAGNQTFRIFQLSGGVYTSIGTITFTATATAKTTYSPAAVSMPSVTTAATDGIYFDLWYQDNTGAGGDSATVYESTSATAGVSSDMQITTSVFTASGAALSAECAGVGALSATFSLATALTAECDGVGTLSGTLSTSSGGIALAVTMAGTGTLASSIYRATILTDSPIRYYRLGEASGTVATDSSSQAKNGTINGTVTYGQTGLLVGDANTSLSFAGIGWITETGTGLPTGAAPWSVETWMSMPTASGTQTMLSFGGGSGVYLFIDATGHPGGTLSGNHVAGVILTAGNVYYLCETYDGTTLLLAVGDPSTGTITTYTLGTGTAALTGGTLYIGNDSFSEDFFGGQQEAAVYSAALSAGQVAAHYTASLTSLLLKTALSTTMPGVGTLSGTLSTAGGGVALSVTMAGTGTLSETLSLATALSVVCVGVGTLSGTMAAKTALTTTLPGMGTLSGTLSGTTPLAVTMPGVGMLSGTPTLATALTTTMAGVGTLAPTLSAALALPATTIPGVGTLAGTLALKTALTTTLVGTGTLSATVTEKTALTVTLSGVGTLSGTLSTGNTVALSATCAGAGTLSGSLALGTALTTTLAGVGTLSGTSTLKTALTSTIAGTGTLSSTLSAGMALSPATIAGAGTLSGSLAYTVVLSGALAGAGTLSGVASVRMALTVICASMGTLAGIMSLFNTLAQPGIALVLDSLYHQAALGDSLVQQATASDALCGQATTSDMLLNQATTSDVSPGSVTLSDQG